VRPPAQRAAIKKAVSPTQTGTRRIGMKTICTLTFCLLALVASGARARADNGITDTTILIGSHGPPTGNASFVGLGSRAGMELAVQEINDAGGINGRKLQLTFEDDSNSPAKALAADKKLVEEDKVFMILGLSGSNPTIGTLAYLRDQKVPGYFSIASAPQVTHPFNRYLFRGAVPESARYGELYSEFITQFLQVKRVAILSGNDENAKNEGENVTKYLDRWYGLKPVIRQEIKNPRSKLRGIGGRKEADQKNAASCGEYVPKEIQAG
jgi:branched-chain amino acid transport system substrate-binding protein